VIAALVSIIIGVFLNIIGYESADPDSKRNRAIAFTFFYTFGAGLIFLAVFLYLGMGCKTIY
jgi:multisubunit Na+/H+ antiporter MnhG subunit